ncbi:MAG TPA: PhzF family phenazine biosynthesis protein, partial [Burkholderiales bacterium]|nr:PhzF family phenazine biosynthesis protein [Burkholderiales bacterium]
MKKARPFRQVDVFTEVPFNGNPVAVILDAEGLTTLEMQRIANWTNLSETTFVLPATEASADYRLRIFTPKRELPFAGHPTIGSAWALLESGLQPKNGGRLIQQCGKGLITLRLEGTHIYFELPEPSFEERSENNLAAAALAIAEEEILDSSIVDVGAIWHTVRLQSRE